MFKPLPYISSDELQSIYERATRTPGGCLILEPVGRRNPNTIVIDGECFTVTRLVWAENEGDAGLEDHEVVHVPSCPYTGGDWRRPGGMTPLCIEPTHLQLATPQERAQNQILREGVSDGR